MRVIAGSARSLSLKTPKGVNTRPTLDRIKETLFNILRDDVPEAVFADIFAGSGGIGIEALSRGARHAYFIDSNREAIECIEHNLKHTHLEDRASILKGDIYSQLFNIKEKAVDIIYIDPPYEGGFEESLFEIFSKLSYITEKTLIILEADIKKSFDFEGFSLIREKTYKTNKHLFFKKTLRGTENEQGNLPGLV